MARGVTQEELAEAVGISVPTYRRLERGQVDNPPLRYLANAALALGCELDTLIEDDWRTWKVFDQAHPAPPVPERFWRRPRGRGSELLSELVERGLRP